MARATPQHSHTLTHDYPRHPSPVGGQCPSAFSVERNPEGLHRDESVGVEPLGTRVSILCLLFAQLEAGGAEDVEQLLLARRGEEVGLRHAAVLEARWVQQRARATLVAIVLMIGDRLHRGSGDVGADRGHTEDTVGRALVAPARTHRLAQVLVRLLLFRCVIAKALPHAPLWAALAGHAEHMLRVGESTEAKVFRLAKRLAAELVVVLEQLLNDHWRRLVRGVQMGIHSLCDASLVGLARASAEAVVVGVDAAIHVHPIVLARPLLPWLVIGVRRDVQLPLRLRHNALCWVKQVLRLVAAYLLRRRLTEALGADGRWELMATHKLLTERLALVRQIERLLLL
mmetsp:Transcript_45806/g.120138  ORF Transcript_45806/g.120138 Transcript_45806/m.120138 type:complete len:343 (-) Transcript_45806:380-1408(-)